MVKVSKELVAGVRGHRHTARTSLLMSWQIGEWKSRGKRKDHFLKATPFLVPRTEIVVSGMFPRGNRKRLEKQEWVWGWRWGAGLQNWIECHSPFLLLLTGEDKVVFLTRSRMSLCTLGVWESALAFQLCCGWSVILPSAAEPSPAHMSGTIIARLAPFKRSRYASA